MENLKDQIVNKTDQSFSKNKNEKKSHTYMGIKENVFITHLTNMKILFYIKKKKTVRKVGQIFVIWIHWIISNQFSKNKNIIPF